MTSKFSAFKISNSVIDFSQIIMKKIECTNSFCGSGALQLLNSGGTIDSSRFEENLSFSNGGSISIINLSS